MRNNFNIILFSFFLFLFQLTKGQEAAGIQLLTVSKQDKVLLRWAINDPYTWKKANEYGYFLERITISRNEEAVLPPERVLLSKPPIKPAPLMEWEILANKDQNAAIIAQALYGESFSVGQQGTIGTIMAINQEQEQRYTFALMAADQSYEAAKLAGWGYEDTTVKSGEKYLYKISIANPPEGFSCQPASSYASTDFYIPLPKPIGLVSLFQDGFVELNWDYGSLSSTYTSYLVERSEDNQKYQQLNDYPIFNAEKNQEGKITALSYSDSVPNGKKLYYRIKGVTSFGEIGPASEPTSGTAKESLKYVPQITGKTMPDDKTVTIQWEFDPAGNELLQGFELRRSTTDLDGYETVLANISPEKRQITYNKLQRVNYFKIVAIGKNGYERPSHATLVQPVDDIPPAIPQGLSATVDTLGMVSLSWIENTEPDLGGYRIFRSNNPKTEFTQITKDVWKNAAYTDTINVKDLNKKVYYKILAEDQRYNPSDFTDVFVIDKPDITPPSPPVIQKYELQEMAVVLTWIPSSSEDVSLHEVYRKEINESDRPWERIAKISDSLTTSYTDISPISNKKYAYTVIAKDKTGLESTPANPVKLTVTGALYQKLISRFNATPNRELRNITLSWKVKGNQITEYLLYKTEGDNDLVLFKTFNKEVTRYEDTDLKINSKYTYALQVVLTNGQQSEIKKVLLEY